MSLVLFGYLGSLALVSSLSIYSKNAKWEVKCWALPEKFFAEAHRVLREGSWKIAVALHFIPKTMKGKEFLKKIFYGNLVLLKEEIEEGMCEYRPPERISSDNPNFEYKVIYAVGRIGWI